MGNSHCIPQAPRRLRASFSRKPSLKGNREDGARKLAGLFGTEAGADGDTTADKIFHYIPGTNIPGLQSQQEILEQPFLSVFKEGRRRAAVRSLGSVVHYAKVQLRFQHSQNVSDCYLELFSSHLYFQAHGPEGLTFQGLLPLMELSVCPLEGSREHAFQITGPLPAPLLVLCPSQAELGRWLYHLEKQIALVGGVPRCPPEPLQGPTEDALPWTLQHRLTRLRTASGRQVMGSAICASRVKLQHLPSQEQWDRLLVLYPTSLAIFSEEADGLCFKGELPLSAIHINLEEKEKQIRSFLIEGRLINTIRVVCASYEDYSHWLLCLQTVCREDRASPPPGPESLPGLRASTQLSLDSSPEAPDHSLETPHSPLYADPYTPPATSHRKITDVQSLDEFLSVMQSSLGPEPSSLFCSVPVSVPVSDSSCGLSGPLLLSEKAVPRARASRHHRASIKGWGPQPPDSPQLVSPEKEASPNPSPPPPDGRPPQGYGSVQDKALSPSQRQGPRGAPEPERGLIQWI
ncbi:hypothetical protein MJG53_011238 [Ovis ammon polii x Ovis aries]|uniref:Uncharacterized protein n=1 Tax=Ovis ammon polii x Ovis aries TaxID=2918886 RepID=A0ACB9US36_9CETA|nr:hypothetical protein MJG53_011238 [Ovis ammon polii x Ovis aries]